MYASQLLRAGLNMVLYSTLSLKVPSATALANSSHNADRITSRMHHACITQASRKLAMCAGHATCAGVSKGQGATAVHAMPSIVKSGAEKRWEGKCQ